MQLIQQVRQAMRLGLLGPGDQLPTVKDVVARVAINPNTVLKAYRELEYEGLVSPRPGVGTFVTRSLTDASLAAHGPLRAELRDWLARARAGIQIHVEDLAAHIAGHERCDTGARWQELLPAYQALGSGTDQGLPSSRHDDSVISTS
jgi:DNA-binding transcriptional regulator YhcF (GntR family)